MRHTRAHTGNRRSHHALSEGAISNEAKDGLHLRHRVSPVTGKYKGEQVLDLSKKVEKNLSKKKAIKESKKPVEAKPEKPAKKVKKEKTEKATAKKTEKEVELVAEKVKEEETK